LTLTGGLWPASTRRMRSTSARGAVARIYATHAFDVRNHVTQVRNPHTYTVMWQWTDHEPIALPITTQSFTDAMTEAQRVWDRIK